MERTTLPGAFKSRMQDLLADGFNNFEIAHSEIAPVSIRLNPFKQVDINYLALNSPVPWCPYGWYLNERPVFTLDPLFHGGVYYVQEASSMILWEVLKSIVSKDQPIKALDLCAAPGGKTSLIASYLHPDAIIVANEVVRSRYNILRENMIRWGCRNTILSNADPRSFEGLKSSFDLVLVDAPCSGEGLFRKDHGAIAQWSLNLGDQCALRQKDIIQQAAQLVAPGGVLIYSTCTYNPEENDKLVEKFCDGNLFHECSFDFDPAWNVCRKSLGYQLFPHLSKGEGFYFAVLQNQAGLKKLRSNGSLPGADLNAGQLNLINKWVNNPGDYQFLMDRKNRIIQIPNAHIKFCGELNAGLKNGLEFFSPGTIKGKDFVPSHSLALSGVCSSSIPVCKLDKNSALHYLKRDPVCVEKAALKWNLVSHQGILLGWIKNISGRINNYFPIEYRIRMDLKKFSQDDF